MLEVVDLLTALSRVDLEVVVLGLRPWWRSTPLEEGFLLVSPSW